MIVDSPSLAAEGGRGMRTLERAVRYAERRRREGLLQVRTLTQLGSSLVPRREQRPAQSILRRDAA